MRILAASFVAIALTACGGASESSPAEEDLHYDHRAVIIETDGGTVLVRADVADTPAERRKGLSGRSEIPRDFGMVFVYFEPTTTGFWMKDTLVPLSIAWFDEDGRIFEIRDLPLCRSEPCPVYTPHRPYRGALEVARGAFDDWGVEVGDTIRIAN